LHRILTVIGARPQFIKAAIVSKSFKESNFIEEIIVHTGQHFDYKMDKIFFDELNIPNPKFKLNINSVSHGEMTGRMMIELEKIIIQEKPDYVLVYGDTNSTLAGSLAAKKLHTKIIHVEAGLRSCNMKMPEEINRILTDRISDILFCPTKTAVKNLQNEGFEKFDCKIVNSGDVMLDLAIYSRKFIKDISIDFLHSDETDFVLATIHREENTNDLSKLRSILNALNKIASERKVILPLHPRTKKIIESNKLKLNFEIVEPLSYFEMLKLLEKCSFVITDSGGLQKEAFFSKKNCLTVRNETEWSELVENGYNVLTGADEIKIYDAYKNMIDKKNIFDEKFYGNGHAASIILETLQNL
jgi:UDP-GlcNAc3NAcA epimerase